MVPEILRVDENTGIGFYTQVCAENGGKDNFAELHALLIRNEKGEWNVSDFVLKRVEDFPIPSGEHRVDIEYLEMVRAGGVVNGKVYLLHGFPDFYHYNRFPMPISLGVMEIGIKDDRIEMVRDVFLENTKGNIWSDVFIRDERTIEFLGCYTDENTSTLSILQINPLSGEVKKKAELPDSLVPDSLLFNTKPINCWEENLMPEKIKILRMRNTFYIPVYRYYYGDVKEAYLLNEYGEKETNMEWEFKEEWISSFTFYSSNDCIWAFKHSNENIPSLYVWDGTGWIKSPAKVDEYGCIVDDIRNEIMCGGSSTFTIIDKDGNVVKKLKEVGPILGLWEDSAEFLGNGEWVVSIYFDPYRQTIQNRTYWVDNFWWTEVSLLKRYDENGILKVEKYFPLSQLSPTVCPYPPSRSIE